jgi:hypothetical protein
VVKNLGIFLLHILLLLPLQTFAFGREGHQIVAQLAMHFMSDTARKNVQHYLGATSPEEASTWMDEMRSNPKYDDFMKSWHHLYLPKGSD